MKFLAGILAGLLLLGLGAAAFVLSGTFDVSAAVPPSKLEKQLGELALDRSVSRRAPKTSNPVAPSPEALQTGLAHYRGMCVTCHGAPGVDPSEIGVGLNPPAPDLTVSKVQARTDGELFWLVSRGIRLTGMPAFGPTHKDEEIWKIVAFLRHLPELTQAEEQQLRAAGGEHEHMEPEPAEAKQTETKKPEPKKPEPKHTHQPGAPEHKH